MVFDFVLTVLIVVHTPRVYPIEAKEKKPRGPEGGGGGGGGGHSQKHLHSLCSRSRANTVP